MSILDIAIIVILILGLIIGFSKGLMKQIFATFSWLAAIILAFYLCTPTANWSETNSIGSFQPYTYFETKIDGFVTSKLGEYADTEITEENCEEVVQGAVEQMGMPKFLNNILVKQLTKSEYVSGYNGTIKDYFVPILTKLALQVICFLIIFILGLILLKILGSLLIKLFDSGILGFANKLAGGVLGVVIALIFVNLLMFGLTFLAGVVTQVGTFVQTNVETSNGLAAYFYNENWISMLVANGFDFGALIEKIGSDLSKVNG